jgi:membrane protease YdiL (CAAX protease family)
VAQLDFNDFAFLTALAIALAITLNSSRDRAKITALDDGPDERRVRIYRSIALAQLLLAALVLVAWRLADRSWAELGLGYPGTWQFWAVAAAVALAAGAYWIGAWVIRHLDGDRLEMREFVVKSGASKLFPRSARELAHWRILAASTAAEELFYRGFILAYATAATDLLTASVLSCALFALAHGYQGVSGMLTTGMFGALLLLAYLISGSLWPGIVLHVVQNVFSGVVGYSILAPREAAQPSDSAQQQPLASTERAGEKG